VLFRSDRKQNKKIDTRIRKANAVLRELYRSVVTNREISNTAKLLVFKPVVVSAPICRHEYRVLIESALSQVQATDMGFLQ